MLLLNPSFESGLLTPGNGAGNTPVAIFSVNQSNWIITEHNELTQFLTGTIMRIEQTKKKPKLYLFAEKTKHYRNITETGEG